MFNYIAINTGISIDYNFDGVKFSSGLDKKKSQKDLFLSIEGLEGDIQSDRLHHGGQYKAVCFYSYDNYNYWENILNIKLESGAFGETISTQGLTEKNACIGDIYQIGDAIIQITQPRQPCYKFGYFYKYKNFPVEMENTGFTGFYGKVLKEGKIKINGKIELLEKDEANISVDFVNNLMIKDKENKHSMEKAMKVSSLAPNIYKIFSNRLDGNLEKTDERLFGNMLNPEK